MVATDVKRNHRVVVTQHGGPEVLQLMEEDLPEPSAGEARVRVLAAGVSAYDLMHRRSGKLPGVPKVPFTPGEDIVGVIDELGRGVTSLEIGQRVAGGTFVLHGGGYSEYVCLPSSDLVIVPEGVDSAEAVCLVVNYLTADLALRTANVGKGDRILVHGAAGGVGSALLDLGRLAGLEVYGTASKQNHEFVSSMGAIPIDYRTEDFVERIRSLTGDGVNAVLDPIGGAKQLWRSNQALRKGGRLVWFGVAATSRSGMGVIPMSLLMKGLLMLLPDGKKSLTTPDLAKTTRMETLSDLLESLSKRLLKPIVADRIPLAEASRAHAMLERGGLVGKLVLTTNA